MRGPGKAVAGIAGQGVGPQDGEETGDIGKGRFGVKHTVHVKTYASGHIKW